VLYIHLGYTILSKLRGTRGKVIGQGESEKDAGMISRGGIMPRRLKSLQNDIRVAIIGMGAMGKGLFYQCHITPGIKCVAIADIKIDKAVACVEWMKLNYRIAHGLKTVHEAIRQGFVAVCEDGDLLARCELVNVLVESSNSIGAAGKFAVEVLEHEKHLVLMNAEI